MKTYTKPKTNVIELDPEQAILQVCDVGGAYFAPGSTKCIFTGAIPINCPNSVRGVATGNMASASSTATAPS